MWEAEQPSLERVVQDAVGQEQAGLRSEEVVEGAHQETLEDRQVS